MQGLAGKVALVTGAGRAGGLGEGILLRLAAEGCLLVASDIGVSAATEGGANLGTSEELESVATGLREKGAEVLTRPCDVSSPEQVAAMVAATEERFGRLDILVNNAGIGFEMRHLAELSPGQWQRVIDVNLTGAFLCTKAAAALMKKGGRGGRVINIASQAAKSGFPHMAPYVASKHGLIGLTRTAAIDLAGDAITVNAICPNHVTTKLGEVQNAYFAAYSGQSLEAYLEAMRARIPLGRVGLPDDTAAAVAFLASDDAAFITGEALNVSGGEEMH
jgi:meso-butanediol dehydrogenase/(S,S)-butanediol dehydrogenase/diacetyl reductase